MFAKASVIRFGLDPPYMQVWKQLLVGLPCLGRPEVADGSMRPTRVFRLG